MFERFTKHAQGVVKGAIAEAGRRGDQRAGTQHLLVAILDTPLCFDPALLGNLDLPAQTVRDALEDLDRDALAAVGVDLESTAGAPGREPWAVPSEWPGRRKAPSFTDGARDVLAGSLAEAVTARTRRIGPEHILLALLVVPPQDPVAQVYRHLDVDALAVYAAVRGAIDGAASAV